MIKTIFDSTVDLASLIEPGTPVAILGCSQCASVYKTGDTDRIEEVARSLEGHCPVVVVASIDAPCDQRTLRFLTRTIPRFGECRCFVVLACEAGARSLGTLVSNLDGEPRKVVSPVRTTGFAVIGLDGTSHGACLFCDVCHRPDRGSLCPVAACPMARSDGPCQDRTSEVCVVDPTMRCSWLTPRLLPRSAPVAWRRPRNANLGRESVAPAAVFPPPRDLGQVRELAAGIPGWNLRTLFVDDAPEGLTPLVVLQTLLQLAVPAELGLVLHGLDRSERTLAADLRTAAALGVRRVLIRGAASPERRIASRSTVSLVELAAGTLGPEALVLAQNAFLHPADVALLEAQIEVGLDLVASRLLPGHAREAASRFAGRLVPLVLVDESTGPIDAGSRPAVLDLSRLTPHLALEVSRRVLR
ncbi:MAG: methylenetetrahydrofolate reductase C-terminal domain-containing protein [Candidatus Riflebacteria bacterium]|nr:methylenetetrahydrofolate reductase C-terminal domain-containing protein [Candidatus Riflebacteria bacterium]